MTGSDHNDEEGRMATETPEQETQQQGTPDRQRSTPTFVVLRQVVAQVTERDVPAWIVVAEDVVATSKDTAIEEVVGDPREESVWGEWKAVPMRVWRGGVAYDEPQRVASRRKID